MEKKKRNAKVTKAKILKEARTLFSKQGYDATTVDDIGSASGVNKALIYYYFQNKSGLYAEVMSELFDTIYEEIQKAAEGSQTVVAELEIFIASYTSYAYQNPYFPALLLRELSDSGAHLPDVMFTRMQRLFLLLSDILKRGESQKIFKKSIPILVHFMIIGSLNLMVTTQTLRTKAMLFDQSIDTCSQCTSDEVAKYVFETIKKSLEPITKEIK